MKKIFYILLIFFFNSPVHSHSSDYDGIVRIEMEVFRNNEIIGYSNYFFEHENDFMTVKNYTQFKVKLLGATIFSLSSEAIEKFKKDKLIYFKSNTSQNNKEKYVNLALDESKNKFIIDGSSYKGEANVDCIIGSWWNHKILKATEQISPLSGSIKEQMVTYVGEENIELYGKTYLTSHYKLKSKDQNLPDNKKLNFDIWLNKKNNLILKVKYKRMGEWEYRLKSFQ